MTQAMEDTEWREVTRRKRRSVFDRLGNHSIMKDSWKSQGKKTIAVFPRPSNADRVQNISHSIYVTNFPDSSTPRDLWSACSVYGSVVDVFITLKKSKAGKRFAFVRFVKVHNLDRLVENLCTVWIGSHHLFANRVRYERPLRNYSSLNSPRNDSIRPLISPSPVQHGHKAGSYVNAVNKSSSVTQGPMLSLVPALVLDDECLIDRDLSKCLTGKVKNASSIPNLYTIFRDEGFPDIKLTYLGGLWVMIECGNQIIKDNMRKHKGVFSWFQDLLDARNDFVSEERIVWVDLEGVPLNAWSRATFSRIGKLWGEALFLESDSDHSFG